MRKTIIAAAAALTLAGGGLASWTVAALAQPAPPGPPGMHLGFPMPGGPEEMDRPMMGGPRGEHGPMEMMRHHRWRLGALIVPAEDRKLTGADVQKIAEAYLLWNGNHSWKVGEVAENGDNTVSFAFTTEKGDVIARYRMDRRTGHVDRVS